MYINAIQSANANISANAVTLKKEESLGINDFFKLMAAQLENQSMFDTVDNTQFIAQMAQFSTLTQISELNNTVKVNTAVSLIGKTVSVNSVDEDGKSKIKVGTVEQVSYNSGVPYLFVDGGFYLLTDVLDVGPANAVVDVEDPTDELI